jgi:hypothetical protein
MTGMENNFPDPLEHEAKRYSPFLRWMITRIFGFLLWIPLLNRLFRRSFSMLCMYIALLHRNEEYHLVYKFLLQILRSPVYNKESKKDQWWFFMRLTVAMMQEQQIHSLLINPDLEHALIDLGKNGPGEKIGYNIAYSFVGYSLWYFEQAEVSEAIEMVKTASLADESWGYPEYLHGWYGLFVGSEDSVEHFSKAVKIDWNFLHRMRRDRTCQQFPQVIKKVNSQVLVANSSNQS